MHNSIHTDMYRSFNSEHELNLYRDTIGKILNSKLRTYIIHEINEPVSIVNNVYYMYDKTLVVKDDFNIEEFCKLIDKRYKATWCGIEDEICIRTKTNTKIFILFIRYKDLKNYQLRHYQSLITQSSYTINITTNIGDIIPPNTLELIQFYNKLELPILTACNNIPLFKVDGDDTLYTIDEICRHNDLYTKNVRLTI